jgi:hypothetical protein
MQIDKYYQQRKWCDEQMNIKGKDSNTIQRRHNQKNPIFGCGIED